MRVLKILSLLCLIFGLSMVSCKTPVEQRVQTGGAEVIAFRTLPFDLTEVKLLEGPFKHATELNIASLLNYEPDKSRALWRVGE